MATWIEPVCDRTDADVNEAKAQIAKWVAMKLSGVLVETRSLKGCLNVSDLNRIEGNIEYLSNQLSELAYNASTSSKAWVRSDLPTARDVKRIINNVKSIIKTFCQQESAPELPEDMSEFAQINAIEENLQLLKELVDNMISGFPKCGSYSAGADRILPKMR